VVKFKSIAKKTSKNKQGNYREEKKRINRFVIVTRILMILHIIFLVVIPLVLIDWPNLLIFVMVYMAVFFILTLINFVPVYFF